MAGLKEDLLEAADGLARRCDCGGGANGFKHGPDCVSEYAPIVRSHATAVAAQEAELADLRERLAFSRAGNATLTDCGAGMARELSALRVKLGEAVKALTEIAEMDIDWAMGTGDNVGTLQSIAEKALSTLETP